MVKLGLLILPQLSIAAAALAQLTMEKKLSRNGGHCHHQQYEQLVCIFLISVPQRENNQGPAFGRTQK
jgi:hypothetical protein